MARAGASGDGRPPGMMSVARLANVSHQTVSRVINNPDSVRPEIRQRVRDAMETLGYRRNYAARTLVTGRSATLGVLSYDATLYGPAAATLFGTEQAATLAGYSVSIAMIHDAGSRSVGLAIERLLVQSVAGVLVVAPFPLTLPKDVPAVGMLGAANSDGSWVSVDQERGARIATEYLLGQGHQDVRHVAGHAKWSEARNRIHGWRGALIDAGIDPTDPQVGDWSARSGYDAGLRLAEDLSVTAVFAANDQMALGLLKAMDECGRRVPDDVSVVGFDDIPEAAFFRPSLTTVRQDFAEVGRRGVSLLLDQIDRQDSPGPVQVDVEPTLVIRESGGRGAARR